MQLPLINGDSVDNNVDYRDALPVNMYAINKKILNSEGYMINFFGLTDYAQGVGKDRGAIWVSTLALEGMYRVSGNALISIDENGAVTNLGEIPGAEQVSMAFSFNNLAIVADEKLFYYNLGAGLREITDPNVGKPIDIIWIDGVFVLTDARIIYQSDIANEEIFNTLDFADAEFIPDPSRGLGKNEDDELVVFGAFSIEHFQNIGSANFLFQRINSKAQKIGIIGTHCKKEMNGRWYTVSRRNETSTSFHIISLGTEKVISSRDTDQILDKYTEKELKNVTMDVAVIDNTRFVIYHLPRDTLLFNENIADTMGVDNAWSIIKTDVLGDDVFRGKNLVRDARNSKWTIGDKIDNRIGFLDKSVSTHYNEIVEWILFTPFVKLETMSIDLLEIETIPGVTADNTPSTAIKFSSAIGINQFQSWRPDGDISFEIGKSYVFSSFVKDNGARFVNINLPDAVFGPNSDISFDLVNKVVDSNPGNNTFGIIDAENGWLRVWVSMIASVTGLTRLELIAIIGGGTSLSTIGDGTGIFSGGVQTEEGTIPSKYTKTNGFKKGNNLTIWSENISHWVNQTDTTMISNGIGPMLFTDDATVGISFTVDGRTYSNEFFQLYGEKNDYNTRFWTTRLGYIRNYFGVKLRGASRSRMAFANLRIGFS